LNELKQTLDVKWGYACYGSLWYDPMMQAINAFNDSVNEKVTGEVTIELYKGKANVVSLISPFALDYASFNNDEGYEFKVNNSASFIEIYSLQMKLANQIKKNK